ncbi:MAG: hypothetical protein LBQ77_03350 [Treponema sp.]|nr:hypothetical protein [Treponema sp.]
MLCLWGQTSCLETLCHLGTDPSPLTDNKVNGDRPQEREGLIDFENLESLKKKTCLPKHALLNILKQ